MPYIFLRENLIFMKFFLLNLTELTLNKAIQVIFFRVLPQNANVFVILWSLKKQKGDEYNAFFKKALLNLVIKCNKYPKI